jgi:tetratricopeptide (TPR) repeat protein
VAACSTAWLASAASAAPPDTQLEESFRQVFKNPGDLGANSSYAQRLVDAGDYERAISTLERVLITDPSRVEVRVEIGALYFRLGSYETARAYFQRALADPNLPAALRPKVEEFLHDIAERLSPSQFTGFASVGGRWQQNANTGPDPTTVRAGGALVTLPSTSRPQSDFSFFGAGKAEHSYDLDTQDEAKIVSTLMGYGTAFTKFSREDLVLGEFTTGIRFKPAPVDLKEFQLRPHIIGNYVGIDGDRYLSTYGFGLDATMTWTERLASEATLEFRREDYGPIAILGDTQHQTGNAKVVKLKTAYEVTERQLLILDMMYRSDAAVRGYFSYTHYQSTLTYSVSYDAPIALNGKAWTIAPYIGWYSRDYQSPDPFDNPVQTRFDNQVRIGIGHTIPFAEGWSTFQQVEHIWADSNVPNYAFQDTAVVLGVTRTF